MGLLARLILAVVLIPLLAGSPGGQSVAAAEEWTWVASPTNSGLEDATLLADGTVLVAGLTNAERYDPMADAWRPAGTLTTYHSSHTTTKLPDGRVLIVGGFALPFTGNAVAEVYDPAANSWTAVASMSSPRVGHTATLLPDGTVLVVGGSADAKNTGLATAERYDPATNRWHPAGAMSTTRVLHFAALLPSGLVLVAGGALTVGGSGGLLATAELYDPATNSWRATGSLPAARMAGGVQLSDGHVLLIGGVSGPGDGRISKTTEIYDPATGQWRAGGMLNMERVTTATLLSSGQVLVTGGDFSGFGLASERYDPATDSWTAAATLNGVTRGSAVLLGDGRVLIVGDLAAEIYRDDAPEPPERCFAETGFCVRGRFLAYWQAHGGLAINGYPLSDEIGQDLPGDGQAHKVQYFERVRLEYHPRNAAPYEVLLGQFGRQILAGVPNAPTASAPPQAGATYFDVTGHNVGPLFMDYWQAHGGLAQFGYPLTELFEQQLEDGKVYQVQYFERARFEYHPENGAPSDILLGQFGRRILAEAGR